MEELIYAMMLSAVRRLSAATKVELMNYFGSAREIFANRMNVREVIPDASDHLVTVLRELVDTRKWAEEELQYCENHNIRPLIITSDDYPNRLRECIDSPIVLYYCGNADLNAARVVSIVGTRRCTPYGNDCIRKLISDLNKNDKNILIVSGLAYGIDVCAHRNALENGMPTIGVMAHGLDEIYPASHRNTASAMTHQGGILTEHPTRTRPDKMNFVSRNRIIAGLSDATVIVESAAKGGGMITCEMARAYSRDVFAFPGRITDTYSEGCNKLIRNNTAAIITSADDLMTAMNWMTDEEISRKRQQGVERQLFPELSPEEQLIVETLQKTNDLQLSILLNATGLAVNRLSPLLFELEMKGIIRTMAGGIYHLIH